ncbi:gag protein [Aphelenchoides avenae]|nr:gag protein [Aphelenchus avenae]
MGTNVAVLYESHRDWQVLIDSLKGEDRAAETDVRETFKAVNNFLELLAQGQQWVDKYKLQQAALIKQIRKLKRKVSAGAPASTPPKDGGLKLPPMELMKYDGNVLRWDEFWDFWNNTVHQSTQYGKSVKMSYLRMSLQGKAKQLLDGYRDTDDNYDTVIALLKREFGSKEAITQALYRELRRMRSFPSDGGTEAFVEFINDIERILRQLQNQKESIETAQIREMIEDKLPRRTLNEVVEARKEAGIAWTTEKLRQKLQDIKNLRQEVDRTYSTTRQFEGLKVSKYAKGTTVTSAASPVRKGAPKLCVFCGDEHWTSDCSVYNTYRKRMDRAKVLGKCAKCLLSGHVTEECDSRKQCHKCKAIGHISALCDRRVDVDSHVITSDSPRNEERCASPQWITTNACKVVAHSNKTSAISESALLIAKKVTVYNATNNQGLAWRTVIFDTASQVSFIRTEVARSLNLIPMQERHLILSNFASKQPLEVWCPVYEVIVKTTDGKKIRLKVHGRDKLLGQVAVVSVKPNVNRLTGTGNAWCVTACMAEVDLIIGSDHYFDFDIKQVAMYHETLRVLDSKVGLIAAGFLPTSLKYAWEHLVPPRQLLRRHRKERHDSVDDAM